MPLHEGKSDKTREKNIEIEIAAGKKPKQAEAIGYAKQRKAEGKDDDKEDKDSTEPALTHKLERAAKKGTGSIIAKEITKARDDDTGKSFKIYSSDSDSARVADINGWAEIKGNPLSKVGVFPYMGRDISPDLEPEQIYSVYRPEEELSNPETIKSFKLLPWTDEHSMLGSVDEGLQPAEKKGVHGTIGEDVYFEDGYLKGNLKVWSTKLAKLIEDGKKELSIGYRCLYEMTPGVYDGQKYDAIQREIRGNHLALVDEGRSGHDVAVLDHFRISFDTKDFKMPDMKREGEIQDEGEEMSLEGCYKMVKALAAKIDSMMNKEGDDINEEEKGYEKEEGEEGEAKKELSEKAAKEGDGKDAEGEYKKFVNKAESTNDTSEEEEMSQDDKPGDMSKPKDKKDGMDTKSVMLEISRRDALAKKLSDHVGTFDHSTKTHKEVAQYGVKKLGLRCAPGHEVSMIEGYLSAARANTVVVGAQDSAPKSSSIDSWLKGVN